MISYFSKSNNFICEQKIISFYENITDWSVMTQEQTIEFYLNHPPKGKRRVFGELSWEDIPQPSIEQLAQAAQADMQTELEWVDLQLKYHATSDASRSVSTVESLNRYAIQCRDYVRNIDGVLTIAGDKPTRPE